MQPEGYRHAPTFAQSQYFHDSVGPASALVAEVDTRAATNAVTTTTRFVARIRNLLDAGFLPKPTFPI